MVDVITVPLGGKHAALALSRLATQSPRKLLYGFKEVLSTRRSPPPLRSMRLHGILCLFSVVACAWGRGVQHVTCGSVVKLFNSYYKVRLHSHDVKYGSGSGQQSVTGTPQQEDHNSNWLIKGTAKKQCKRGEPITCGQTIRLEHLATQKNLHSHHFSSPLSDKQEISAFGEEGEGDSGDEWMVMCDGEEWDRSENIMLRHVDTDQYLGVTGQQYSRPIHGQSEVVGFPRPGLQAKWQTKEGVFINPSQFSDDSRIFHDPSEL